ncbi:MAG: WD40 repeat domain-containing protein [Gammaproteobacteria bacterium]
MRHTSPISGIASFSDQYIATAGYDNRVVLWNAKTHLPITVGHHDHLANQCEFSQCGKYLVTSSSDHTARLWSVPQMKLICVLSDHDDDVECSAIHPYQPIIATASRDNMVRIFDFQGKLIRTFRGHTADVISTQWTNDGKKLITSSDDGTIRVWDIEYEKEIDQLNDSGIQTDALAISNEGIVYAGDDAGNIHVITNNLKQPIFAHQAGIKKIAINDKYKKLISLSYDRKACIWNISSSGALSLETEFFLPNIIWARSCAFYGNDQIVFSTFGDCYAIYDYKTKTWLFDHINDTAGINSVLSKNDNLWTIGDAGLLRHNEKAIKRLPSLCNFLIKCDGIILTGGQSGEIFNAESGEVIYKHRSPLNCATSFEKNGKFHAIIGTYTGEAVLLKQVDNHNIAFVGLISLHNNAIKSLAINRDILFSVCATGAAAWHNLNTHSQLHFLEDAHYKIANDCIAIDQGNFASVSRDLILRIWDGNNFTLKSEISSPHTHSVKCIATDTNFRYLATGAYNGMIKIYDRELSKWKHYRKTNAGISSICFDETNDTFLAASYDGNVYLIEDYHHDRN